MRRDNIINEYFEWLCDYVCDNRFSKNTSYRKLLVLLHDIEFRYSIDMDDNRAYDGTNLRYRFIISQDYDLTYLDVLDDPCSVLEMMIALSIRCEENIMDDPKYGDRTGQWFWGMINSLGLSGMTDNRFDKNYAIDIIERFLDRDYEPNGRGGLFTIKDCDRDLRKVEIWYQLNWYLDSIIGG